MMTSEEREKFRKVRDESEGRRDVKEEKKKKHTGLD